MTVTEFKAYVTNIYAAAANMESTAKIPVGEAVVLSRLVVGTLLAREWVDVPKV